MTAACESPTCSAPLTQYVSTYCVDCGRNKVMALCDRHARMIMYGLVRCSRCLTALESHHSVSLEV